MVMPLYFAMFLPVALVNAPGVELTTGFALTPIVNVALVFREAVAGIYRWPLIGITVAIEVLCVLLSLKLAVLILRYEDFILGTYGGNFLKFLRERLLGAKVPQRGVSK